MSRLMFVLISLATLVSLKAQEKWGYWQQISDPEQANVVLREKFTENVRVYQLDLDALRNSARFSNRSNGYSFELQLPKPDGQFVAVTMEISSVMQPGLQAKFPEIITFQVRGKGFSGRASITPHGFHLMVFEAGRVWFIDPLNQTDQYVVYYKSSLNPSGISDWRCEFESDENHYSDPDSHDITEPAKLMGFRSSHVDRREYRLAVACTGEYAQFHGGTVASAMAAITVAINRINSVYERELAIRFILIEDNDKLVFLDPDTDPYTNNNTGLMLGQNQTTIDNLIGTANYDIGHVFSTSAGGVANLGSVCTSSKARGVTGLGSPVGDPFVIDFVAHEIGHQFGGNHTFNNCDGNENFGTAFEPGSGSTIMAYAGLCGSNNVQFNSDDYFHVGSLQEMAIFSRLGAGNSCANLVTTENTTPEISILSPGNVVIPISTPFELKAIATDIEDETLTFCWEQYNTGPQVTLGNPAGTSPSFRSFRPVISPVRTFPSMNLILSGSSNPREVLPTYNRNLTFRCTVRDQHPGAGAMSWAQINFSTSTQAGPFRVVNPVSNQILKSGSFFEINWDVANTDQTPVNCTHVDIIMSRNRGISWTDTLAKGIPNNGSHNIWVPIETTNDARIRINANNNVFFNVNPGVFRIELPSDPDFSFRPLVSNQTLCLPDVLQIPIQTFALSGFEDFVYFEIINDNFPTGTSVSFSENPAIAGSEVFLNVDFGAFNENQAFEFQIAGTSPGKDTLKFPVRINTNKRLVGTITEISPLDNASGVSPGIRFEWEEIADAESYRFLLDSDPGFTNPLLDISELSANSYNTGFPLEEGRVYYWKAMAENICSVLEPDQTFAFQVQVLECENYEKPEDFFISASGTPVYFSDITIANDFPVSSVEIFNVTGNHQFFSDLDFSLIAPTNQEITLIRRRCGNFNGTFDFGFSDFVTDGFGCPPNTGRLFMPTDPLNTVAGISTQGSWRLRVRDNQSGSGGRFTGWNLKLCASKSPESLSILRNEGLVLKTANARHITSEMLRVSAPNTNDNDLVYTLVENVSKGILFKDNFAMTIGAKFSQADINQRRVYYTHYGDEEDTDFFTFVSNVQGGGWTGKQQFNITMDDDFVSGTRWESTSKADFEIYPNPASDRLFIHNFSMETESWLIYNLPGKVMKKLSGFQKVPFSIDVSDLPPGLYFIQSRSPNKISNRSFVRM